MTDETAQQADEQPANPMAARLKANLAKVKEMPPTTPVTVDKAALEEMMRASDARQAEFRERSRDAEEKANRAIEIINGALRSDGEYLVAAETREAADDLRSQRQSVLRRQREGGRLLSGEQKLLDTSALKSEGPETNALTRCFNRISNTFRIKKLYKEDVVSILAEKKAAMEAKVHVPLSVTTAKVKNIQNETWARALLYGMIK